MNRLLTSLHATETAFLIAMAKPRQPSDYAVQSAWSTLLLRLSSSAAMQRECNVVQSGDSVLLFRLSSSAAMQRGSVLQWTCTAAPI